MKQRTKVRDAPAARAGGVRGAPRLLAGSTGEFDILVTDLHLSDGDGRSLFEHFREYRGIPGIIITGSALLAEEEAALSRAAGICKHLTKPASFEGLQRAIEECISRN